MLSLETVARHNPHGIALVGAGVALTFANLFDKSEAAANALGLGEDPEVARAFVASNDAATIALLFALLARGIAALPLNPRWTEGEQRQLAARAGARWISPLARDAKRNSETSRDVALASSDFRAELGHSDDRPQSFTAPTKTQLMIATSGSTSAPKLVCLSHAALEAAARASVEHLGLVREDRWLLSLNLAHIGGVSILLRCLLAEAAVVLSEPGLPVGEMVETIEQTAVTVASFVPIQLERLLASEPPKARLKTLRAVLLGGALAPRPLVVRARAAGWPVLTTYGLSEAASQVAAQPLTDLCDLSPRHDAGIPLTGIELKIDEDVICIRGACLFDGYLGDMGSPFDDAGWFRTGDLGRLSKDGRLIPLGRNDECIVTGGEKVAAAEVENVVLDLPLVLGAAVVPLANDLWGQIVAAAVVLDRTADPTTAVRRIEAELIARLAPYKRPRQWLILQELPTLPSGKLDRGAIVALFEPSRT